MRYLTLYLLTTALAQGAVTYVSSSTGSACSSGATAVASQTCSLSVTAGNQLFVSAAAPQTTVTFSISDGGTNTYTSIASAAGGSARLQTWLVTTLATTATITVTVTPSTSVQVSINLEQVSGSSGVVDVSVVDNTITGTIPVSDRVYQCASITTLTPNAYIYFAGGVRNVNSNVTTITFSPADDTAHPGTTGSGNRLAWGHQTTTTTTTISPSFACTPSGNCASTSNQCMSIAIKDAATGTAGIKHRSISQ